MQLSFKRRCFNVLLVTIVFLHTIRTKIENKVFHNKDQVCAEPHGLKFVGI